MSLKESDWKTVLNQPKNLGLKAVGTGVSELLRRCEVYGKAHHQEETNLMKAEVYAKALKDLEVKCKEVIQKHGKLFTTACEHLKKVQIEAGKQFDLLEGRIVAARIRDKRRDNKLPDKNFQYAGEDH